MQLGRFTTEIQVLNHLCKSKHPRWSQSIINRSGCSGCLWLLPIFFLFSCICWLVFWAVCSLFSAFTLAERSVKNGISSDHILEFIFSSLSHFSAEKKINMLLAVTMTESLCKWQGQWLVSAMRSLLAYSWFVGQKKNHCDLQRGNSKLPVTADSRSYDAAVLIGFCDVAGIISSEWVALK